MTSYLVRASLVRATTQRVKESDWSLAAPMLGAGMLSVPWDLPIRRDAAFGILLAASVVARFYRFIHACETGGGEGLREFSRRSSRMVYLTLYLALLLQLLLRMVSISSSDRGVTLGWSLPFQVDPQQMVMQCGEAFRGHLLYGVMALLLIRGMSAYQHRRRPALQAD